MPSGRQEAIQSFIELLKVLAYRSGTPRDVLLSFIKRAEADGEEGKRLLEFYTETLKTLDSQGLDGTASSSESPEGYEESL